MAAVVAVSRLDSVRVFCRNLLDGRPINRGLTQGIHVTDTIHVGNFEGPRAVQGSTP